MYKVVIKYLLIVCAVLTLGQLEYKDRTLGSYFTGTSKAFGSWAITELAQNPWVAKIVHPKGLDNWFPIGNLNSKKSSLVKEIQAGFGAIEKRSIKEQEETEDDFDLDDEEILNHQQNSDSDDSQLMDILP